jgi:hypothetical protein
MFMVTFYTISRVFIEKAKLVHLALQIIQSGQATMGKVVAVKSKRLTSDDAPFQYHEYAALVEFPSTVFCEIMLKWVKVNRACFEEIKTVVQHQTTETEYPASLTGTNLQSLKNASKGLYELTIYSSSQIPKSAVSNDPGVVGLHVFSKVMIFSGLIVMRGGAWTCIFVINLACKGI